MRAIGEGLAEATDAEAVLDVLCQAPARLADVRGSSAFLFARAAGEPTSSCADGGVHARRRARRSRREPLFS